MTKLGQHFLKNKKIIKEILGAAELEKEDLVLEIGAGHGELTSELVKTKTKILAVEKDKKLFEFLKKKFSQEKNLTILNQDILKVLENISKLIPANKNFKIIGNIPYYLTGALLRRLGEIKPRPQICVLMLQEEVGKRLCAKHPNYNRLGAIVQFWSEPEIIKIVSKKNFYPQPKVDSSIIKLKIKKEEPKIDFRKYCWIVNILFKQPRKTILNNLLVVNKNKNFWLKFLKKTGINPLDRPQNLNIDQIINISKFIDKYREFYTLH